MAARVLPFIAYLAFLTVTQLVSYLYPSGAMVGEVSSFVTLWLYPVKVIVVLALLYRFWPCYDELSNRQFKSPKDLLIATVVGLLVYGAWVRMDWPWAMQSDSDGAGYDPFQAGAAAGVILTMIRIFGAAVIVPLMEELFWRSFLIRYFISSKFESVSLGTFTLFSFLATVVLFGLEHDLWLAGMMAGAAYNGVLYYTKRLWPCVLAHGITNLTLGIHVLVTNEWRWW
jgi:uncharacterized protein